MLPPPLPWFSFDSSFLMTTSGETGSEAIQMYPIVVVVNSYSPVSEIPILQLLRSSFRLFVTYFSVTSSSIMLTSIFPLCEQVTGNMPASKWLRNLDIKMDSVRDSGGLTHRTHLQYINSLLTEDAADWSESNLEALRLLNDSNPTRSTIKQFSFLLKQRFPAYTQLANLRQRSNKTVSNYYTRTVRLILKYRVRDRSPGELLSLTEISHLDTFIRVWIRGLLDVSMKHKATEGMGNPDRPLIVIYLLEKQAGLVEVMSFYYSQPEASVQPAEESTLPELPESTVLPELISQPPVQSAKH